MKLTKVTYNKFTLKLYFDNNEVLPLSVKYGDNLNIVPNDILPRKYWTVVRNISAIVDDYVFHKYLWELPKDRKDVEVFHQYMISCVKYINDVNTDKIRIGGKKIESIIIDDVY